MPDTITIIIDLARSPHVDLNLDETLKLFECLDENAWRTRDLMEAIRIVKNFDEFHRYMKRKFEDYITPPKDSADSILGRVIVHKLRLYKTDGEKRVEIIFDRRFPLEHIDKCLRDLGYANVNVERRTL